jgi:hypothetical protein
MEMGTEVTKMTTATAMATGMESFPAAMGRNF